jgi:hypothetical protein
MVAPSSLEGHLHRWKINPHPRVRLAPATLGECEVLKRAQKHLEPINHSLTAIGSATNFNFYVERTYKPVVLALMAKTTSERYQGIIDTRASL